MNILLVEDNESIIMGLEYLLQQEGYQVLTARSLREADMMISAGNEPKTPQRAAGPLIQENTPDLILLDIALPDGNGFDFCRKVKRKWNFPVIFLTAREEETDVVKGFDLGADDYVIKPFRNRELISRIKSVLRRNGKGSSVLKCHDIVLDMESGRVSKAGTELSLTRLEYRILSTMLAYPDKLFTREEILADIWDISGNYVNDNTLSVTMKRIREKLGDTEGRIIRTVRGIGYRIEK